MDKKEKIIRVAILSDEILGWGSGKHYFHVILDNYSWESDDIIYRFKTISVSDDEIVQGKICVDDFDTFLVPGGGVGDGHALTKAVLLSKKNTIWKKTIAKFVKDGGGYIGICGGAALMTNLKTGTDGFPRTLLERFYAKSALGVSAVHSYYNKLAAPLWYLFQYAHPEKIGAAGYVFSFSPGVTHAGLDLLSGGVPVDCTIERDNPIFSDSSRPILRMRWWGGPAFILPDDPDRLIRVLARYPKLDFSSEKKTRIYAWRYVGGIVGLIKGFFKGLKYVKTKKEKISQAFVYAYYFAGDWEKSDIPIELDFSNRPCLTSEIYPNKNKARIVLCGTHPEYMIWWDGRIEEVDDDSFHCIATGFHQWKDISLKSSDGSKELTYTWWLVRRLVAWSAKVPDDHLPPIDDEYEKIDQIKTLLDEVFWDGTLDQRMKYI